MQEQSIAGCARRPVRKAASALALLVLFFTGAARAHPLYLVNENHTDYGWNATTATYDQALLSDLDYYLGQINATASNPSEEQARFVADCWYALYLYEKNRTPTQFQTLINRIADGHITVPINPLVTLYGALPTEAAIRAGYYPGRLERRYGIHFRHGEDMENQTAPWGLSSIWLGSGAQYSWKGICGCATSAPYQNQNTDVFRWRGPDDRDVLMKWYAYSNDNESWGGYSENRRALDDAQPQLRLQDAINHFAGRGQSLTGLFGYGWDDITSQTTRLVDVATAWNDAHTSTDRAFVSNVADYFAALEPQRSNLPVLRGGWGNDWDLWPAALGERTAKTRRAIEKLRTAEAMGAVVHSVNPNFWPARQSQVEAALLDYFKYFEHTWNDGGVGLQTVIDNKIGWSNSVDQTIAQVEGDAATALGALFNTPNEDRFVVFNPLAFVRTDVAELPVAGTGPYVVTDVATGAQAPSQMIARGGNNYLRIVASNVPSLGYRVYRYAAGTPAALPNAATVTTATGQIENNRWRITVGDSGQLTSVIDKAAGNRELVLSGGAMNGFGSGSSASLNAENVGPVSASIVRTITGPPSRAVRVTLFAGTDRIGIDNDITSSSTALHTYSFVANLSTPQIRFEEVGAIARPGLSPTGDFLPGTRADYMTLNHFVDLAEASTYHVTLSSLDAYAMQVGNSTPFAFDLPTSTVRVLATGNPASSDIANQGGDSAFHAQLALFGASGAYSGAQAMRDSLAHQNPLRTIALARNLTGPFTAATASFLSVSSPNVVVTAVKPAEEGDRGIIARVWELSSSATNFTLNASGFAPAGVFATSLIETDLGSLPLVGGGVTTSIAANAMQTFRFPIAAIGVVPSPTPTTTPLPPTATQTVTRTATRTGTWTVTQTGTRTATRTVTGTATRTQTRTQTRTATRTLPPVVVDGAFVSQSVPTTMSAGQQVNVSVTMRNTGTTTWSSGNLYKLGAINPTDNVTWGTNRVLLAPTDAIGPGQQKTFSFVVTAPSTPGTYNFQWQMMQEGVFWFGAASTNVVVTVTASMTRDAAFVSQSVPTTMNAGQLQFVSITMRNTGTTPWTNANLYRLGAINPYDNTTWGFNRVGLAPGASIAPGQQTTFSFGLTPPATAGTYNFQWRMVQDGVTWFGTETTNVAVTVVGQAPVINAAFVRQSVPAPMIAGQTYEVSVTMRNTGNTAWTAANLFRLGAINPYDNSTWGTNRISLAPGDNIAPNQEKTFTFNVVAPGTGTYNFQWRMVQDGVAWFGPETPNIPINTGPLPTGASSLRFFGTGSGDIDRVKIPLDAPPRPVDVGGDFTLEWWMKTASGNASGACAAGGDSWINGNVLFDRDVNGNGDFGDYGVSLFGTGGRLAFGVNRLGTGTTICGNANVADGTWHHVAATRNATTGAIRLFVDGQPDGVAGTGPTGDVSYRDGRATSSPNDPFLVIGAEKHDLGASFPSYHGWIDEVRVSNTVRYTAAFTRPSAPFVSDANTVALYHFDEDNGNVVVDSSGAAGGPSSGVVRVGGTPQVPQWSTDVPFAAAAPTITLQTLTSALSAPTSITNAGDGRLFITEQAGRVRIWDGTQLLATPFLTVTPIVSGGEQGLLSVAFHPKYSENGFFYVYHNDSAGNVVIARYQVMANNPNVADPASRKVLLTIAHQGATNHNGGQLQFGPDGYLYAGIGDGGGGCDNSGSGCNAQRDNMLLGKLLRLDVDQNVNTPPYYGIPPTNPFAGPGDPLNEIWAKGLRNPWRFMFDRLTRSLFIGDVGQDTREEVDYRPSDDPGGENYGWKRMEGFQCDTCSVTDCPVVPPPCNSPSFTLPILDYDHSFGCAVTGGYVYRGVQVPRLFGKYLYGDLCSGRVWWAVQNGNGWTATQFGGVLPTNLYSFGQDVNGELYIARGDGSLSKVRP